MTSTRNCWCGSDDFAPFNAQYGVCRNCGTLVSGESLTDEQLRVTDDESDFYGKQYWLGHQQDDLGFPDIKARARNDLTERNLHWLRLLMKYRLPPARVMELGCAHGSFVALMQRAGFEARGVEMSPWVVAFGRKTFDVRIDVGPVEALGVEPGTLDAIALMDVLEHLPDPRATMRRCLDLLKPDGVLLIQTPQFRDGMRYDELVATRGAFLEQLKADEHLYLFTEASLERLFADLGAMHVRFEPAIFAMYDLFAVVGRMPLETYGDDRIEAALLETPERRMVLALLDLRAREEAVSRRAAQADADRTARAAQVEELTRLLHESETDRSARAQQIETLDRLLRESDADRQARAGQIESLESLLRTSEADRLSRATQIESLDGLLRASEADRLLRAGQIDALNELLRTSEADRVERAAQIETLDGLLRASEADRLARAGQIEALTTMVKEVEADRLSRGEQVESLNAAMRDAQAEHVRLAAEAGDLSQALQAERAEHARRVAEIEALNAIVHGPDGFRPSNERLRAQVAALDERLAAADAIVAARDAEIASREASAQDVRLAIESLFARNGFRSADALMRWPEARRLRDGIARRDD